MKIPFRYSDSFYVRVDQERPRALLPALYCCQSISSQGPSTSTTNTGTTSGASSPVASEGSQAIGPGSIGVGTNSKYLESGSVDLSGANLATSTSITASSGSTVNITPDSEDPIASQLLNALANGGSIPVSIAGSGSGGGATYVASPSTTSSGSFLDNINWTVVALLGAGIAVLFIFFGRRAS